MVEQHSYLQSDRTCLIRCCGKSEEGRLVFSAKVMPDLKFERQVGISQASERWKGVVGRGSVY